jgi:hypothetical protein
MRDLAFFANSGLVFEGKDLGYKGLKASTDQLIKRTFGEEEKAMQIKDQAIKIEHERREELYSNKHPVLALLYLAQVAVAGLKMPHTLLDATVEVNPPIQPFSPLIYRLPRSLHCSVQRQLSNLNSYFPPLPQVVLPVNPLCIPFRHVLEIPLVPSARSPVSTCTVHTLLRYSPWQLHLYTLTCTGMEYSIHRMQERENGERRVGSVVNDQLSDCHD